MKIQNIHIQNLFGRYDVAWPVGGQAVSILSGINGSGKTTVLKAVALLLQGKTLPESLVHRMTSISVELDGDQRLQWSVDRTKENAPSGAQTLLAFSGTERIEVASLLRNIAVDCIATFDSAPPKPADPSKMMDIQSRTQLYDIFDALFSETGKKINRDKGELEFFFASDGQSHPYADLSSGEKQLVLILLTVFMQQKKSAILIMDEPDISLHVDWQQKLLQTILTLNSECQILVSTHSPLMILDGWHTSVVSMADISAEK
jgi:predicted ATP-binding protein involved in virulence